VSGPSFEPLQPLPPTDARLHDVARLLLPALRWDPVRGWDVARPTLEQGLELGVGGFILFGGPTDAVRELTAELHERSTFPLLIASDLERGAGQQFHGATLLPPAAALGALGDPGIVRRAAALTAREARALGVNWVYAPVADVDLEPENPIVGTRAFGTDAGRVAQLVAAWIHGCRQGGALSCAKHFPGHGRTLGDSHLERPAVDASREALAEDLQPFRAAVAAGVDSIMTAHVAYPALDPGRLPATCSPRILGALLRDEMKFDGIVVTDALNMKGFDEDDDEARGAVMAVAAGCDVLLYPQEVEAVVRELHAARSDGRLEERRVGEALRRVARAAASMAGGPAGEWGREGDLRWAMETALRTLHVVRGGPRLPAGRIRLVEIEDDAGGLHPPYPRTAFPDALRRAGVEISDVGSPLVALYSDVRAWKGRPGISPAAHERLREVTGEAPHATVILFSHPRLSHEIPSARHLLAAWGGEALMQEAAVAWLIREAAVLTSTAAGRDR
jgi:beta-glucosidase-like glycosyl hydrolase